MKEKLTRNLSIKIIALVTALILWLSIINIDDPVKMTEFDNVEVSLINTETVTDNNKICEVLDKSNYISVKIYARRSVLENLDVSNIRAVADLSDIEDSIKIADTTNGNAYLDNIKIALSTNRNNNDLESISASSDYVKVSIEDLKKIQKSIVVDVVGTPADGYVVGNISTNSNLVRIQGPVSVVSKIVSAKVTADVSGFSDTMSWDAEIKLYDANGEEVVSKNLTKSIDKVRTTVEILEQKEVKVTALIDGEPAEGYGLNGVVTIEPSVIRVAGKKGVLDNMNKVTIPSSALNVEGLTESLHTSVAIKNYLPSDIRLADQSFSGTVDVMVGIEKESVTTVTVPLSQLTVTNVPEGYRCNIVEPVGNIVISVKGMRESLEKLNRDGIIATADFNQLSGEDASYNLKEGTEYLLQTEFALNEGVSLQKPYKIKIKLEKLEEE